MAEIKSTLDMVLARAEAMCASLPDLPDDTQLNEGMKFAALYMSGEPADIASKISSLSKAETPMFVDGLLKTFLRFIVLPRDESAQWNVALSGISALAAAILSSVPPELPSIVSELQSLLGRYPEHRLQLQAQLKESFTMQAAQLQDKLAKQTGMKMNIPPEHHPKFKEEWARLSSQIDGQYSNALEQYKGAISKFFV